MNINTDNLRKALEVLRDQPDKLIDIILAQSQRIAQLEDEVSTLKKRLEELEQNSSGSTAPFRIKDEKRVSKPKKPGRKAGHKGSYRHSSEITQQIIVPLSCCPNCSGQLKDVKTVKQVIEEIVPAQLRVVELTTFKASCPKCGNVVSTHPLQVSSAVGCAGVHLGPNALCIIGQLQHRWNLSKRKSCQILKELFGLSLSPGGLVNVCHRLAKKLDPNYKALKQKAQRASALHSDETGWYVGRPGYSLWVLTNPEMTVYEIVESRSRKQLKELIGQNFAGVLISDCLNIYDDVNPIQHKCYSHHLKAISNAIKEHPKGQSNFLSQLKLLLKSAMVVKELKDQISAQNYQKYCQKLQQRAQKLLQKPRGQPQEEAVRKRLFKQIDHLFTFLYYDDVDATNNLAERQLRPAVIARKISCGNRSDKGAHTWQVLASLAATCLQTGASFADLITKSICLNQHPAPAR